MSEETSPGAGILGFFLRMILAGGSYFGMAMLAGADLMTAAIVAAVAAVIGAAYSTMAFSKTIYEVGFLSIRLCPWFGLCPYRLRPTLRQ